MPLRGPGLSQRKVLISWVARPAKCQPWMRASCSWLVWSDVNIWQPLSGSKTILYQFFLCSSTATWEDAGNTAVGTVELMLCLFMKYLPLLVLLYFDLMRTLCFMWGLGFTIGGIVCVCAHKLRFEMVLCHRKVARRQIHVVVNVCDVFIVT